MTKWLTVARTESTESEFEFELLHDGQLGKGQVQNVIDRLQQGLKETYRKL